MISRPEHLGKFEFVILSSLRAAQLLRGCVPRIEGAHKATVIAQIEVSEGKVQLAPKPGPLDEPVAEAAALPLEALV